MAFVVMTLAVVLASASCKQPKDDTKPKKPGTVDKVELLTLKVGTTPIDVKKEMNAGIVNDEKISLEFTTSPADAELTFVPGLETYDPATKKGVWAPGLGKKSLRITVKKADKSEVYTLKLEVVDEKTPIVKTLKVDGRSISSITDEIILPDTEKDKVKVEYTLSPLGATATLTPPLSQEGEWENLVIGENTLVIKVAKGDESKTYTLKLKRLPQLTSITIGPNTKDAEGIIMESTGITEIPVPVNYEGVEYEVKVTTNPADAKVEYDSSSVENNKLKFPPLGRVDDLTKEFTVKVSSNGVVNNYRIKAIMMLTQMGVFASRFKGKYSRATLDEVKQIRNHQPNVKLELVGDRVLMNFRSQSATWKTVLINERNALVPVPSGFNYTGIGELVLPMEKGKSQKISVILSNSEWDNVNNKPRTPYLATEKFEFEIACSNETADAFVDKVFLNDEDITDETDDENAFTALFADPVTEIVSDKKATIKVQLARKRPKSVKIQDKLIEGSDLTEEQEDSGLTLYIAESDEIDVPKDNGVEVTIIVTPEDEDLPNYHVTTMKMKLVNKELTPLTPEEFHINGVDFEDIPNTFKDDLIRGNNPEYEVPSNHLAMHLVFKNKPKKVVMKVGNQTDTAENTSEKTRIVTVPSTVGGNPTFEVDLSLAVDATRKDVELIFTPQDDTVSSEAKWKFKVKGTTNKSSISPTFKEISKDSNLKKDFLDKIKGGEKPEHLVEGTEAKIVITLTEYEHDFLLQELKVNGSAPSNEEFKLVKAFKNNRWILEKTISGLDSTGTTGTDVVVEFNAKPNVADNVKWQFTLKSGGTKPSLPMEHLRWGVGKYGHFGEHFTVEFLEGIKAGTEPTIELYGKNVEMYFNNVQEHNYLRKVKCTVDGTDMDDARPTQVADTWEVRYTIENLTKGVHTINAKIFSRPESGYKDTEYKFKINVLDVLPEPQGYIFSIDGKKRAHGYKAKLDKNFATLSFKVKADVVAGVRMGKSGSLSNVEFPEYKDENNQSYWEASKEVELSNSPEDWIIEVTSKAPTEYAKVEAKFNLQGTDVNENDARFIHENGEARVYPKAKRMEGVNGTYIDTYGVESVDFTAYTMTKESKVKYVRVNDLTDVKMEGEEEKELTRETGTRKLTGNVEVYKNKPTKIKLWVVGKDSTTTNDTHGVYKLRINSTPLYWGYKGFKKINKGTEAYDEIEIKKSKVKNGKICVIFAPWNERLGFSIDTTATAGPWQERFDFAGTVPLRSLYRTFVTVGDMAPNTSREVLCKVVQESDSKEVFVYKAKITMKE